MKPNNSTMTEQEHVAADLNLIVVDADDIISVMKRNERDRDQQHSHVLRVTPPFEGEQPAKSFVSEAHTRYPSEVDPKPLHLVPKTFISEYDPRNPKFPNECNYPNMHESRGRFYDHYDLRGERGDRPSELTDEQEQLWDEWWATELEAWEDHVRHYLQETITLQNRYTNVETTVDVRYE